MKRILYIFVCLSVLAGCEVAEIPEHTPPATAEEVGGTPVDIATFKSLYTGQPTLIEQDLTLCGRVVSSDEEGNFYNSFYIQDATGGIEIKSGGSGLFLRYPLGREIFVKAYHLTLGGYHGMVSLGYASGDPTKENVALDAKLLVKTTIFPGQTYAPLAPTDLTDGSQVNAALLGCAVRLVGVTYQGGKDGLKTWAYKADPYVIDDTSSTGTQYFDFAGGLRIEVRTSGYSDFAGVTVPFTVGQQVDISGVLSRYDATWQLTINTDKDAVAHQ